MTPEGVYVLGAGGHAKVVIATLLAAGHQIVGVLDDAPSRHGTLVQGFPVLGPVELLADRVAPRCVIAIGNNTVRARLAASVEALSKDIEWVIARHPSAVVADSVRLGPGTVVFAGAVVQPDAELGAHVIVNTGASVDHDSVLRDFVHVAPGARLAGNVTLETGVLLGLAAGVIPGRKVGAWTVVGAGAVVVSDLPDGVTAVGVPARPLQTGG